MSELRTPIVTSVGIIRGRDAVYLDEIMQVGNTLTVRGEINSTLCSNCDSKKWIKYELRFLGISSYRVWSLDIYPSELNMVSSFDMVGDSTWARQLDRASSNHYILQTYDFVYEILALEHEFQIGKSRMQVSLSRKDCLAAMDIQKIEPRKS